MRTFIVITVFAAVACGGSIEAPIPNGDPDSAVAQDAGPDTPPSCVCDKRYQDWCHCYIPTDAMITFPGDR